jgi:hypothetical protein
MKPNRKRASFPSRSGTPNGRRREALPVLDRSEGIVQMNRHRAAREMGFSPAEADAFVHGQPLTGKHFSRPGALHPETFRELSKNSMVVNAFSVQRKWVARMRRYMQLPEFASFRGGVNPEQVGHVMRDAVLFFSRHYSDMRSVEQLALSYLAGANITQPPIPVSLARQRKQFRFFFHRVEQMSSGRMRNALTGRSVKHKLTFTPFRIAKRKQ